MQFPQDDEKLVAFIRHYCPLPPPATVSLERRLMSLVEKDAHNCHKRATWKFFLPAAGAASLLLAWGGYNWFATQQQPQFTAKPQAAELETFLVESWQGTVGEPTNSLSPASTETEWLALADFRNKSAINSVSQP